MSFLDIVLGGLLLYGLIKGIKNGLFTELASFLSLIVGIYLAIKFSSVVSEVVGQVVSWSPKTVAITAFALTFIAVVLGIMLLAKVFTEMMSFAYLGWVNRLAGGFFSILKMVLILSVVFNLFQKINFNNWLVKEETFNQSMFYNPIQKVSQLVFPKLETWYEDFKTKTVKSQEAKV
ncbi:colicin V production protein [Flavobacterium faecale]|uniref:Colicin V production protein n=1 Tax=Flavobacterium faecale TaxID=1355330 RepID=A0A2S1LB66_9FLAO|nr:CvpA family protein [Flavobacterium faecale]AWG20957.1 colicin V production protein [Flavobacterium faecale]